jgi:hypothetical protein
MDTIADTLPGDEHVQPALRAVSLSIAGEKQQPGVHVSRAWTEAVWSDTADMPWVAADGGGALDLKLPAWTATVDPVSCDCINTYLKPHVGGFLEPHWSARVWFLVVWCWRYIALSVNVAISRRAIRRHSEQEHTRAQERQARDLLPPRSSARVQGAEEPTAPPLLQDAPAPPPKAAAPWQVLAAFT